MSLRTTSEHGLNHFSFQTWIRTSIRNTRVLLATYASDSSQDDPLFFIQIQPPNVILLVYKQEGNNDQTFSIELNSLLSVTDGSWHHVLIFITSESAVTYVDGKERGSVQLSQLTQPTLSQIFLYVGTTKYNDVAPFNGLFWGTSFGFDFNSQDVYPSLSCALSCGETLYSNLTADLDISVYSYKTTFQTTSFEILLNLLDQVHYNNVAFEPSTHNRLIHIHVSDGRSETNATVSVDVELVNDHVATLDLNFGRSAYYYVDPQNVPHREFLTKSLDFVDEDTTQTDYKLKIELMPPNQRFL